MKIINPSVEIIMTDNPIYVLRKIEKCGRLCYQSEDRITLDSYIKFIKGIIARGHLSVIEHGSATAIVVCDRGVSHEIVRHRIGSYSQESTRYVNYKEGLEVIKPCFWEDNNQLMHLWEQYIQISENGYKMLIEQGATPEQARTVLPNSLKTQIAITYNFREWRHFFQIRGAKNAHPQIREIASIILEKMKQTIPIVFDDIII